MYEYVNGSPNAMLFNASTVLTLSSNSLALIELINSPFDVNIIDCTGNVYFSNANFEKADISSSLLLFEISSKSATNDHELTKDAFSNLIMDELSNGPSRRVRPEPQHD